MTELGIESHGNRVDKTDRKLILSIIADSHRPAGGELSGIAVLNKPLGSDTTETAEKTVC